MATLDDEKDINDIDDDEDESTETLAEPSQALSDPNEPVEIETDEQKLSKRREKRQARRNEFEQLRRERDELRAQVMARPQQSYEQPRQQIHPAAQRLQEIDNAQAQLYKEYEIVASRPGYNRNGPEEAEYQRKANALQTARIAAVVEARGPQFNEQDLIRKIRWDNFTSENADVHGADGNTPAWRWALAKHAQMVAEGKPDTKEMAYEILDQARVRFGLKPRRGGGSTPTPADRQRFTGVSSRAGAASQGSSGNVVMGPNEKRMARIAFEGKKVNGKEMTDDQKYQYWANTVGKKLQEQKRQGG